jgi:hypothetical protein
LQRRLLGGEPHQPGNKGNGLRTGLAARPAVDGSPTTNSAVSEPTFSADGTLLLLLSRDSAYVWDVQENEVINVLRGHQGFLRTGTFSANGRHILMAADDGTVRVWENRGVHELVTKARSRVFRSLTPGELHDFGLSTEGPRSSEGAFPAAERPLEPRLRRCAAPSGDQIRDQFLTFSPPGAGQAVGGPHACNYGSRHMGAVIDSVTSATHHKARQTS